MTDDLIALFAIVTAAFLCPIISQMIPRRPISETVLLLISGTILGPHLLDIVPESDPITLLNDLGLGFLFLLAGYEINPQILTGHQGKRGIVTWLITLGWAFIVVVLWPTFDALSMEGLAVTITLTSTAIGTLLPILEERGLLHTRIGETILAYGTWGELMPVLAMTLLLSTQAEWRTVLVLLVFIGIAIISAIIPARMRKAGHFIFKKIDENAETNAQMIVRACLLLLVALITISAVFDLDIVLGAFAAGFILRYVIPEGSDVMENKLHSIAFGFFVPLFFIISGTKINLVAVVDQPALLFVFIILLLFVRALPIFIAITLDKGSPKMSVQNRLTVAFYCTTALPIIVAVTSVAVNYGVMTNEIASILITAGGVTVLVMPILGQITLRTVDAKPIEALKEIRASGSFFGVIRKHRRMEKTIHQKEIQHEKELRFGLRDPNYYNGEVPLEEKVTGEGTMTAWDAAFIDKEGKEVVPHIISLDRALDKEDELVAETDVRTAALLDEETIGKRDHAEEKQKKGKRRQPRKTHTEEKR